MTLKDVISVIKEETVDIETLKYGTWFWTTYNVKALKNAETNLTVTDLVDIKPLLNAKVSNIRISGNKICISLE